MTEKLLQFIWQYKYFNGSVLRTTTDQQIEIIYPGSLNSNQGPDFLDAKIKIDNTLWAGSIEVHIKASEWIQHKHSFDENYKNVILHVVWDEDEDVRLPFPTLQLNGRVSGLLLNKYEELMQSPLFIPCQNHLSQTEAIVLANWKERLLIERLQKKTVEIEHMLSGNNQHWEEVFWWMLAGNFGLKVNSDSFEKIAQTIPVNLLSKHRGQIHQLEALLFGQAGLLDKKFADEYPNLLRREYRFLQKKYGLKKVHFPLFFLRMRPANFPTIRLAQLAALIHDSHHLFSRVREEDSINAIVELLSVTANDYWHYHYRPDELSGFSRKTLGRQMVENIIINTIIPVLYAYGYYHNSDIYKNKALRWMEELPAERNSITRGFTEIGLKNAHAFDSQALIQLKNIYCNYRRCLQCAVGARLLKS